MAEHASNPERNSDSTREVDEAPATDALADVETASSAPRRQIARRALSYFQKNALTIVITFVPSCMAGHFVSDELLDPRLPRGVNVLGVDISRVEPARAKQALAPVARARLEKPVRVALGGKTAELVPGNVGYSFDLDATIGAALHERRGRGPFVRWASWARAFFVAWPPVTPVLRENAQALSQALDALERSTLELPFSGGFHLEKGRIVAEYPQRGRALDRSAASERIRSAVLRGDQRAELVVHEVEPPVDRAAIDQLVERARRLSAAEVTLSDATGARRLALRAAEIALALRVRMAAGQRPELYFDGDVLLQELGERRAGLENAPKSARFIVRPDDRVDIEPSEAELRLTAAGLAEAVERAALSDTRAGELPLQRGAEPELSTEQARALSIKGKVSSFTTRHPCCERRVENIHRIADLLDGLVVKPGETVSVNAIIGPRTTKNGFVPAPTIEEGEMVETIGGGISQFATTFFNALFYGGYDIIERQPHTYWFPRYPMGHEATLSYPHPDLVFRNDTEAGMLIHTAYSKTTITVSIYGDNGGRRVRAEVSDRKDIVKPALEIVPNPAIAPDKEHTLQAGMIGWSVVVGRVIQFPDGTKKEERRKVTYRPKVRRVEVHPCRVPEGEKGYTGEKCPEPADSGESSDTADANTG